MKHAYVIGSPIAHSLSPVLHNSAYRETDLDYEFMRQEVTEHDLEQFMSQLSEEVIGLAVTMPLKQRIIPLLDVVEPLAQAVGAVNTVVPSGRVLAGFNTDVYGIVEALRESGSADERPEAVILGARATASSALAALGELHVGATTVIARSFAGPGSITLAEARLGVSTTHLPWRDTERAISTLERADIIVSTLPAGIADHWAELFTPRSDALILDAAYDPWPSKLAQKATSAGAQAVPGSLMLLHQARRQFELMTGHEAPTATMRNALYEVLHPHA
ncbi:MAG: shikimate dehydrogenase [Actinomycetaceae bacterium]|nr:shikimate dehydrogenase [Actinomycetaceae bacterium]